MYRNLKFCKVTHLRNFFLTNWLIIGGSCNGLRIAKPLLSLLELLFQNDSLCKTIHAKMSLICMKNWTWRGNIFSCMCEWFCAKTCYDTFRQKATQTWDIGATTTGCRLFGAGWSHCALLLRKMIYVLLLNWLLWYLGGTGMVGSILFAWTQGYVNFYLQCTSLTRMFCLWLYRDNDL